MNALTITIPDINNAPQVVSTLDTLIADGGQVTIGAKADTAATSGSGSFSLVALLKSLVAATGQPTDASAVNTDATALSHTQILKEISKQVQFFNQGHGLAATAVRVELPTDGTGLTGAQIADGVTPGNKATVAQFHNSDNQSPGGSAFGLLTGGVAQSINAAGNLDRQRATGADQIPGRGIMTGAAQFAQEVYTTTTTSVSSGAATAVLTVAVTAGFQVGGTLNFEPLFSGAAPVRYESALITAVVPNTSITVAFPSGGALFTHTQPYLIQSFLFNQERDFSGEGPTAQGVGAAIATEFESNSGGPPLSNGLPTLWTLDADRNIQGKNSNQMAITSTTGGNTSLVFTNNPWIAGLVVGQTIILSATANGAAVEAVIVAKNNTPATGAGPITVNLVNPVVTSGSLFATFDAYGIGLPSVASVMGTEDTLIWLYDPAAADPKRPLAAHAKAPGVVGPGAALVSSDGTKPTYRSAAVALTFFSTSAAVLLELVGSATKTVRVKKIRIWGQAATKFFAELTLLRCTAASAGTPTAGPKGQHDKNDAAATAVVNYYQAAAAAGTGSAVIGGRSMPMAVPSGSVQMAEAVWDFSQSQDKALVLRGAADVLEVFNNTTGFGSGTFGYELEWEEDNS